MFTRRKWKKVLAGGFIMLLMSFASIGFFAKPQPVQAAGPVAVTFTVETIFNKIADYFKNAIVTALRRAGENAFQLLLQRLAHDAAVWIASGGNGQGPLFQYKGPLEYIGDIGSQVAGEFVGDLNRDWNVGFDLCNPEDPQLKLQLKLGVLQSIQPRKPRCDIFQTIKNWERLGENLKANFVKQFEPKELLSMFQQAFQPGNNDIGMMFTLNDKMRVSATAQYTSAMLDRGVKSGDFTDYTGIVSKRVQTPRNVVTEQFMINALKNPADQKTAEILATYISGAVRPETYPQALLATVTSTFINTLGSELQKRLMEGLFKALNPSDQNAGNNIYTGVAYTGRSAAEAQFAELKRPPIQIEANIDYLSEFASCPDRYRGINNCVVDGDFVTAVTQFNATREGMTVKEAIDQDLLHGDWLIYPIDHIKNTEENGMSCYRDGYCHRNLMRLRRARILPVGWEMVTQLCNRDTSPSGVSCSRNDPPKLRDVVANYNNCDPKNPESIFCHLIDPNWVLKAPTTQCLAKVPGPIIQGAGVAQRQDICVDDASCIVEDDNGSCQAYGYCTREKNIWRFGGEKCEARFEGCRSYRDASGGDVSLIESTIDPGVCDSSNAGCMWYARLKDSNGVWSDASQSRIYFNKQVQECDEEDVGCTRFIRTAGGLGTNLLSNPGFEDNDDANSTLPDGWSEVSAQVSGPTVPVGIQGTLQNPNIATLPSAVGTLGNNTTLIPAGSGIQYSSDATKAYQENGAVLPSTKGIYQNVRVLSRHSYSLSAYVMNSSIVTGKAVLEVQLYNEGKLVRTLTDKFDVQNGTSHNRISLDFSITDQVDMARIVFKQEASGAAIWFDAVMLQELLPGGALAADFENYGAKNIVHLKRAPESLGCYKRWDKFKTEFDCTSEGGEFDARLEICNAPQACQAFAGWCTEGEVGCNLFKQTQGDSPAVAGTPFGEDYCPQSCAGYTSFIQKGTNFEDGENLEFFIPSTARQCNLENVGCEEFTNLEADNSEGAEAKEYYSMLRACKKPDQSCKTFYTWEGSDTEGFQLRTFTFESNGTAPKITGTDTCDEAKFKSKAFPDCREFYHVDDKGVTHITYASLSKTTLCSDECTTYRKTNSAGKVECEKYGGTWDANQQACIVTGLPRESKACTAEFAGCREYKGNTGNNVRTAFIDDFEDGTNGSWDGGQNSNVAVKSFERSLWNRFKSTLSKDITSNVSQGNSYVISFYARSRSKAGATLSVKYSTKNFSQSVVSSQLVNQNATLQINDTWQEYTVGPVTFWEDGANITQVLLEMSDVALQELYIDKIQLQEITDRVFIVKDSWNTPLQCDNTNITPFGRLGANQPSRDNLQAQLNCKEYRDKDNNLYYLKSFSSLCREDAVGCEALINTQNTAEAGNVRYNALCDATTGTVDTAKGTCTLNVGGDNKPTCKVPQGETQCYIDKVLSGAVNQTCNATTGTISNGICTVRKSGVSCRIVGGASSCNIGSIFKYDASEVVTDSDIMEFLVNDPKHECDATIEGCQEIALPTLDADGKVDTKQPESKRWTTKYFLNQPDKYSTTLCNGDELYCEEFTGTNNVKKYFKNPGQRTCEFKTNVQIVKNGVSTLGSGWFKTNPSGSDPEPCYPSFTIDPNKPLTADGQIVGSWDVLGQQQYHLVKKDSKDYRGWVGLCPESQNMCTLFVDPLGTADPTEQNKVDISHYFYLKNDKIDTKSCNGQVSISEGCILFNDTSTDTVNGYHAETTYDQSNKQNGKLIQPITCEDVTDIQNPPAGKEFCKDYGIKGVSGIGLGSGQQVRSGPVVAPPRNNTNTIIKVTRDRTCGEWLTCQSATKAKDNGKPITLCSKLVRCTSYNASSGLGKCDDTVVPNFDRLTIDYYQKRGGEKYSSKGDVIGWTDRDYSGYSIPNYYGIDTFVGLGFEKEKDKGEFDYRLFHDTQNKDPNSDIRLGVCEEDKDCAAEYVDDSDPNNKVAYKPTCVNNRCVLNLDGSRVPRDTSTGKLNELKLGQVSPAPSCRAYPDDEAPFPIEVYNLDSISSDYARANFCENCEGYSCSYNKVTYGNQSETRYYGLGKKPYLGLCVGGQKDGSECNPEDQNACKVPDDNGGYKDVGSTCQYQDKRIQEFNGWEGYCLERDYSVGTRSINAPDYLAPCITWMPVRYMTGLRNLYENYETAGFNVSEEVRYCAETTLVRDVYTGSVMCANQHDWKCDDSEVDRRECRDNMVCPEGHFIVHGGCNSWNATGKDKDEGFCTSFIDQCPYQCVPMGSRHTIGRTAFGGSSFEIKKGDSCWQTALKFGTGSVRKFKSGYHYSVETTNANIYGQNNQGISRNDSKGHLVPLDKKRAGNENIGHTVFEDCVLPNVDVTNSAVGEQYSKPDVFGEYRLACKTLVQVNALKGTGKNAEWVNKALTDRVAYDASTFDKPDGDPLDNYGWDYHKGRFEFRTGPANPYSLAKGRYVAQKDPSEERIDVSKADPFTGFVHPVSACRDKDKEPTYFGYGVRPYQGEDTKTKIYCNTNKYPAPILARGSDQTRPNQVSVAFLFESSGETTSFHKAEFSLNYVEKIDSTYECFVRNGDSDCAVCENQSRLAVKCTDNKDCSISADGQTLSLGTCDVSGSTKACQKMAYAVPYKYAKDICGQEIPTNQQSGAGRKLCYSTSCTTDQECSTSCNKTIGACNGGKIMTESTVDNKTSNSILVGACKGTGNICTKNSDCFGTCNQFPTREGQKANNAKGWCSFSRVAAGDSKVQSQGEGSDQAIKRLQELFARVYEAWRLVPNLGTNELDYFSIANDQEANTAYNNKPDLPRDYPRFAYDTQLYDWNNKTGKPSGAPTDKNGYIWDISDGSGNYAPIPPKFAADSLAGDGEGPEGSVSVNGTIYDPLTSQAVELEEGTPVLLSFYAWANKNQMPLRNVVVSWTQNGQNYRWKDPSTRNFATCSGPTTAGDSECATKTGSSQSFCDSFGTSTQNYCQLKTQTYQSPVFTGRYKNRRSVCNVVDDSGVPGKGFGGAERFEATDGSCDTDPFIFEHLYVLREVVTRNNKPVAEFTCEKFGGQLVEQVPVNTAYGTVPRKGCKFTIQVHLKDNWGWCTGNCNTSEGGNFGGCYDYESNPLNSAGKDNYCSLKQDKLGNASKAWKDAATVIVYERDK